MPKFMGSRFN
jgi:hypothetical protein